MTLPRPATAMRALWISLIIAGAALGLAYSAHLHGRPVTAALVCVFGVVAIASLLGVRAGVVAGIVASLAYNMLFTQPYLEFRIDSVDDLVPIIALNFSAIASGLIAGRLRDRAVAAEDARRRISDLLRFSEELQRAVTLRQVEEIIRGSLGDGTAELFLQRDGELLSPSGSAPRHWLVQELWDSLLPQLDSEREKAFLLKGADGRIGVLVVAGDGPGRDRHDVRVLLPLIVLAVQRCSLAEELTKADVIRRSEQFKTTLLSSVSHDLRTPLAAIAASASSLASPQSDLDEETRSDLLATIQEQSERLDRLTTNLLNLGRIEGGLDVDDMPVVDAVEVLGMALSRVRKLGADHGFERDFRIGSASVRADEPLLQQLFFNVLENATVHSPGGGAVKVSADVARGSLIVSIEDDGPGIPADIRDRIFDRFYQARDRGGSRGGSGLGLPIARGFAEIIGGTISAGEASPPLGGARIDIALPLAG